MTAPTTPHAEVSATLGLDIDPPSLPPVTADQRAFIDSWVTAYLVSLGFQLAPAPNPTPPSA